MGREAGNYNEVDGHGEKTQTPASEELDRMVLELQRSKGTAKEQELKKDLFDYISPLLNQIVDVFYLQHRSILDKNSISKNDLRAEAELLLLEKYNRWDKKERKESGKSFSNFSTFFFRTVLHNYLNQRIRNLRGIRGERAIKDADASKEEYRDIENFPNPDPSPEMMVSKAEQRKPVKDHLNRLISEHPMEAMILMARFYPVNEWQELEANFRKASDTSDTAKIETIKAGLEKLLEYARDPSKLDKERLSHEKIGEILGLSHEWVRQIERRAKKLLKARLK